jgi:hypothetical protein
LFILKYLINELRASNIELFGKLRHCFRGLPGPNASPMERKEGKLVRFTPVVLTSKDIRDTLVALKSHASGLLGPLGKEGSFSFSIHKSGRFRVAYMTQRGSYVISIIKTPFEIPTIEELCQDPSHVIKEINRIVGDLSGRCVVYNGLQRWFKEAENHELAKYYFTAACPSRQRFPTGNALTPIGQVPGIRALG